MFLRKYKALNKKNIVDLYTTDSFASVQSEDSLKDNDNQNVRNNK